MNANGSRDALHAELSQIVERNPDVAAVALANKNARIAWALLAHDRRYRADYAGASV